MDVQDRTHAREALAVGTKAPEFELNSTPNERVSLEDFRGHPLVMAFYPADWSPVCSDQMALYQEVMPLFKEFDASTSGSPSTAPHRRSPTATAKALLGDRMACGTYRTLAVCLLTHAARRAS
ncbi:MAG: redoxin domain-containing protein [Actinomycetota bacterium]